MAATEKKQMWFYSSRNGSSPEVTTGLIAGSMGVLMPGAPMYLSDSGTWKVADTTDGTGDVWHGFLVGLSDRTATWPLTAELDANTSIKVALIHEDHRYCIFCENNGTDSAVAQANVGNDYGLTVSTTATQLGYTTLDLNATTNVGAVVVDIMSNIEPRKFTTSDSPGVAVVRFTTAVIEAHKA